MGFRRDLGPPGHGILCVFLFALASAVGVGYAIVDRVFESLWPEQGQSSQTRNNLLVCVRDGDHLLIFRSDTPEFLAEFERVAYKDDADRRVLLRVQLAESRKKAWPDRWSASRCSATLTFASQLNMPGFTGAMLDGDEQLQVLRHFQRRPPQFFPALLNNSSSLTVTRTDGLAVAHNLIRWILVMLVPIVFGLGAWRIVRAERRYAREYHDSCVVCGYSLVGLASERCPECGVVRRAYGENTPSPGGEE